MTDNALTKTNDLPMRDGGGDRDEVQCPACGAWRPGFCVTELDLAAALVFGTQWACDGDISRWRRQLAASL